VSEGLLLLVRHGVTDWNREGRWQGRLDPALSEDGHREAQLAAARIAGDPRLRPARIVTSSLRRASETAEVIGAAVGVSVELDDRLVEISAGEWEGRTHAELEVTDGERYRAWRSNDGVGQPPGGESPTEAAERVRDVLASLGGTPAWPVLLVSHGGTLRILARLLLDLRGEPMRALDLDNASISAAARAGAIWRLERWNDTLHLLGRTSIHVDELEGRPLAL